MNFDKIISDKHIIGGSPCLKGKRITVFNLVCFLDDEQTKTEDYIREFPGVTPEHIYQAIVYCKDKLCLKDDKLYNFCDGCTFDILRNNGNGLEDIGEIILKDSSIINNPNNVNKVYIISDEDEDPLNQDGYNGWEMAQRIFVRLSPNWS